MHKEYVDITCVFSMYEGRTFSMRSMGGCRAQTIRTVLSFYVIRIP